MALFKNFSIGTKTYKDAHKLIVKHRLWWYVIAPGIINAALFIGVVLLGIYSGKQIIEWFYELIGITGNETGFLHFLYSLLSFIVKIIVIIIFFLVYLSTYKYLVLIIVSPLLAVLSDKTSRLITGRNVPYSFRQLAIDVWRGTLLVFRNILIELAFTIACFFLGYVPIIKYACPVFLFLVSMYFYGFSMIYFSHECYRMKIRESVRFVRRNNGFAIANGMVFYGLLAIPFVGILIAPAYSVVAANIGMNQILEEEKKAAAPRIRISAVSYLNTLPYVYGLQHSERSYQFDLKLEVPSQCAESFKNGEADIALVPAGSLLKLENYRFIPDLCIGSTGNVKTVLLLSQVPLEQIKKIHLDQDSLTSVNLVKILARHFWKINPAWHNADQAEQPDFSSLVSVVAIGNKTFELSKKFAYVYDLSDEWYKFTGLPFVFACWIARNSVSDEMISLVSAALKTGLDHKKEAIEELFDTNEFPDIGIQEYLEKNIDFVFDEQKHKALALFLDYIKTIE